MAVFVRNDNTEAVKDELEEAIARALERVALQAESFAKANCPVDTGNLRNSISHTVKEHTAYIGTNVKYAPYIEFGTGKFAETGGRQTPWVYNDGKGHFYRTEGMKAKPFLRPAVTDHSAEYRAIIRDELNT